MPKYFNIIPQGKTYGIFGRSALVDYGNTILYEMLSVVQKENNDLCIWYDFNPTSSAATEPH
ncbi:hypothetical protein MTsPCn9_22740 [Croceitalea sp. MTPC9]|nr:hypothetical protein MTsPCn6_23520 [Croceitalea sp. MTPC6]GMN17338.1 hypothetical protein MTsPCn9_22740 [Croceitalea sp. MTPC9]